MAWKCLSHVQVYSTWVRQMNNKASENEVITATGITAPMVTCRDRVQLQGLRWSVELGSTQLLGRERCTGQAGRQTAVCIFQRMSQDKEEELPFGYLSGFFPWRVDLQKAGGHIPHLGKD